MGSIISMILPLALTLPAVAVMASTKPTGIASIKNAKGATIGTATFTPTTGGLRVVVQVKGLNAGKHMIHLHEFGKCEAPDFKSAGRHFDPGGKPKHGSHGHGSRKPAGDLPDIMIKADGTGRLEAVLPKLTANKDPKDPFSIFKEGGTSIIIHAGTEGKSNVPGLDYKARIACGVIKPTN